MGDHHLHLFPHEPSDGGPGADTDLVAWIESYVEHGAARGVAELGFTEHLYRCVESEPVLGRFWEWETDRELADHTRRFVEADRTLSLETYVEAILDAQDRGLPVALGLEVDFFPETFPAVLELIDPYPWDFLIGSVHWIGGWAIDSSDAAHGYERKGIQWAWDRYFELATELAATGGVDVLAHIDLPKKYGYRLPVEPVAAYGEVVAAAAESGTAVEVSSQGLRKPADEVYPAPTLLRMFHDAGVPITLASDAHVPEEAGWGHEEVAEAARAAGYTTRLRFERRRRFEVPL